MSSDVVATNVVFMFGVVISIYLYWFSWWLTLKTWCMNLVLGVDFAHSPAVGELSQCNAKCKDCLAIEDQGSNYQSSNICTVFLCYD